MKKRIIMSEMERLNSKGVLDDDNLRRIREHYDYEKINNKRFSTYLTVIGLVMISLGVILLFAYNWSQLSREVKTGTLIILLLLSQGLFGYSLWKEKKWTSGAGTMVFAVSGLSIAMILQMYNISGSETGYFMTWTVLNLPTFYLCRSNLVGIPYLIILFLYLESGGNIISYLLLVAPVLLLEKKEERYSLMGEGIMKVIALTGILYWYEGMSPTGAYYLLFYAGVLGLIYLWPAGLKKVAEIGIIFMAYILTMKGSYTPVGTMEFTTKMIVSWTVYLGALGSLVYLKRWRDPINYNLVLILPAIFLGMGELFYNLYFFGLGLLYIWEGVSKNQVRIFNKGSLLLFIIFMTRFLDYNISTLVRGVVFIVLGICLISGNLCLSRRKL